MANNSKAVSGSYEGTIANSLQDALLALNLEYIYEGKFYLKRYYANQNKTKVDILFAVGIFNGTGQACYKIISEAGRIVIWNIIEQLPDVTELIGGQLYVYRNLQREQNFLVYLKSGNRLVEPVQFPMITYNSSDGRLYYVSPKKIVDIYAHLENAENVDDRFQDLESKLEDLENRFNDHLEDIAVTTTTTIKPAEEILEITSFTMDCDSYVEIGSTVSPKFTWTYNYDVDLQSFNGEILDVVQRSITVPDVTDDRTFTLEANRKQSLVKATKKIGFSPMAFLGGPSQFSASYVTPENFNEIFAENDTMEAGLSDVMCIPGSKVTKTFEFTEKSFVLMAYPLEVADRMTTTDSNGYGVTWNTNDITITNKYGVEIPYRIYSSPSASEEGFTYIFNY